MKTSNKKVTVYGAYGHTGRFVVSELLKRGLTPILSGRDNEKLQTPGKKYYGQEVRPASVGDPLSLDHALEGAAAVINCAGPFLDTSKPVIEAAIRSRIHYIDVTAEQQAARAAFEEYSNAAREAEIVILPAMAFYGGLADLLATAAMGNWDEADKIMVAVALDSWKPTLGTRLTGKRNTFQRMVVSNGGLEPLADPPPTKTWSFPDPFGTQDLVALPFSEIITISRHLRSREVHSFMNLTPLTDLRDPGTPPPVVDESGRSPQIFVMQVAVRKGSDERLATARGRDIYAITAPIVAEAVMRVLDGRFKTTGVHAAGEIFDAADFLQSLPAEIDIEISPIAANVR